MQKTRIIIRYQASDSRGHSITPADAGKAEKVVHCVANLAHKETVENIVLNHSHVLHRKGEGYTYEVKFVRQGQSKTRRFTVYRLSGMNAKSECYQVTDPKGEYIVVKIPPQPITEINAYLDAVVYERSLAEKLAGLGIKVVVSSISSVMRHLHKLESAMNMTASKIEEAYIEILRSPDNAFIDYLKIDGSFVFFMEYLDEPFLGDVVRDFHREERLSDLKRDLVEKDYNLISDYNRLGFLSEYKNVGTKKAVDDIYHELRHFYEIFSSQLTSILRKFDLSSDQAEMRRDLYIAIVLGKPFDTSYLNTRQFNAVDRDAFFHEISGLVERSGRIPGTLAKYLEALDHEAYWLAFKHNSQNIKKIGDNLLVLLTKLEEMGLALRDLKVDNLFISNADNMELGVIDLETGGDTGSGDIEGIVPAGMPGNMTVSNLLFISQLQRLYGNDNIGNVLHMQDWYATVATIFEAVTGKTLFEEARDYIIMINNDIETKAASEFSDYAGNHPGTEVDTDLIESFLTLSDETVKGHTWNFFALARRDLRRNSFDYSDRLKEIQFSLPDALCNKILADIELQCQSILLEYGKYRLTDITGNYLDARTAKITDLRKNLTLKKQVHVTNKTNPSVEPSTQLALLLELDALQTCIELKQKENLLIKKRCILEKKLATAFALFPIMLDFIIEVMCRDEWQAYRPTMDVRPRPLEDAGSQLEDPATAWPASIAPNKEDLADRANRSRIFWQKNREIDDPDSQKTIKKSIPS